jgi:hypothetical protein
MIFAEVGGFVFSAYMMSEISTILMLAQLLGSSQLFPLGIRCKSRLSYQSLDNM